MTRLIVNLTKNEPPALTGKRRSGSSERGETKENQHERRTEEAHALSPYPPAAFASRLFLFGDIGPVSFFMRADEVWQFFVDDELAHFADRYIAVVIKQRADGLINTPSQSSAIPGGGFLRE